MALRKTITISCPSLSMTQDYLPKQANLSVDTIISKAPSSIWRIFRLTAGARHSPAVAKRKRSQSQAPGSASPAYTHLMCSDISAGEVL
ncbi:hypothetical protein VTJ49DRAFT_564 [Mycothermus thermophilus]|uniref:Uncharacterized protein n=1 Tax=Humicola insolens TaxID=85995 RepID=A0ABR3VFV7_HUMIN